MGTSLYESAGTYALNLVSFPIFFFPPFFWIGGEGFRNKFQQYLMKIHENKEENYNIFCHKIQIMRPKIGSVKYSSFELFLLGWVTDEERNNHWAALNLFDLGPIQGRCVVESVVWNRV